MAFSAGAVARAGRPAVVDAPGRPRWAPSAVELRLALGALVALFVLFVAVQLRVLFGGADYVQETTGLGYGDYARRGFVQLLLVAALTLGVVAVAAARSSDRVVRGLLGALCVSTLVVLASAYHRLDLVEGAYGLTRVRDAGRVVVAWIAVVVAATLLAGVRPRLGRHLPRALTALTLAGVLGYSLSNPDARIAGSAVQRAEAGKVIDRVFLRTLSADALGALERLPPDVRARVLPTVRGRLDRPDGLAGLNLARRAAR